MQLPLQDSSFNLDVTGIAGFFGGEEAISAMASVHIYRGRRWLGWYNSPGSYTIGKKYGQLAKSRLWDGLYPGVNVDPAVMLELDGQTGPKYEGLASGTIIKRTSHLGYLFARYCRQQRPSTVVKGRTTTPSGVTIVHLTKAPERELRPSLPSTFTPLIALVAIGANLATCVIAGVYAQWYAFSMILLGMLCNGFSCFVIGSGKLIFKHPIPPPAAPKGDGFLMDDDQVIVVKGPEGAVNSITRGQFLLHYRSESEYHDIGISSAALTIQFLLQLFLIPQSGLFGQILFLVSLAVSYAYNAFLSSIDKEKSQQHILLRIMEPDGKLAMQKFVLPNRTSMTVFVMLTALPMEMLTHPDESQRDRPRAVLDSFIPNSTPVWDVWKHVVLEDVQRVFQKGGLRVGELPVDFSEQMFMASEGDQAALDGDERRLLSVLLRDARDGFNGFLEGVKNSHRMVDTGAPELNMEVDEEEVKA
ncbi:hypothetical protein HGRIS_000628 [Hohenbuehelia grisea]|uniref:Uncharacterized protein n=1 Tax=Hohenbuehelia grisea TaxID=104357 RepID=A0ABR3JRK0_9AGAR